MSNTTTTPNEHRVLRLWVRRAEAATPDEQPALTLIAAEGRDGRGGVEGDHKLGAKRHVTLIFEDDWNEATAELGHDVDPAGRRANVLLSGGDGGALIGTTVHIGETVIDIRSETAPCDIMNQAADGLEDALKPNCRAGVWGVIRTGGTLRVGDALQR